MSHRKAPSVKHDAPKMKGERARTKDGTLREKRGDTLVGTIEEQYHVDFGVRKDMKLETLRARTGMSLSELIEQHKGK